MKTVRHLKIDETTADVVASEAQGERDTLWIGKTIVFQTEDEQDFAYVFARVLAAVRRDIIREEGAES